VKFLKFDAQKNIGDQRVKCLYENDLARFFRKCGILPHVEEERQDAASTIEAWADETPALRIDFFGAVVPMMRNVEDKKSEKNEKRGTKKVHHQTLGSGRVKKSIGK
jgi:hypothetical protein